jgi:hypothetical protein
MIRIERRNPRLESVSRFGHLFGAGEGVRKGSHEHDLAPAIALLQKYNKDFAALFDE